MRPVIPCEQPLRYRNKMSFSLVAGQQPGGLDTGYGFKMVSASRISQKFSTECCNPFCCHMHLRWWLSSPMCDKAQLLLSLRYMPMSALINLHGV